MSKNFIYLLKLQHYWSLPIRLFIVICGALVGESLTLLQRYSRCIQQPQPNGPRLFRVISRTLVGGVKALCKDVVGVFYSPGRLGKDCSVSYPEHSGGVLPLCKYVVGVFYCPRAKIVLCHIRDIPWGSLSSLQTCSRCILQHRPTKP